ncbi:MAG: ribosomal RNA small subunit methyltransferase A [Deltaproteobacteria bacterium]|nr:ribosomal RNA small subunit methyltransferase A [Deltaproteobacteria bacterium]MBW1984205.1 ribosomal RNA small subunit methyltransferase A [Deltaproteobacteria bacterium]
MTSPKTLLSAWNLRPRKRLGQNFLSDPSTAKMIVSRSNITSDDVILEIGAGLGALTIPLAMTAKKVYAVEKDPELLKLLNTELLTHHLSNVVLIQKDILSLDLSGIFKSEGRKLFVAGNLPYNISSQILVQLIKHRNYVTRAVLMFQKELASRLISKPSCKDYGRLSVMLQYCADLKSLAHIKATMFFPTPKVDSEILEITFKDRSGDSVSDEIFLFKVIKASFGRRRKTLRNSLAGSELQINAKTAETALEQSDIDPQRRAETLTVTEFVCLSNNLQGILTDKKPS